MSKKPKQKYGIGRTGIAVSPNSAPDSFTPKNLNLVRDPEHTEEEGAVLVLVVVVGAPPPPLFVVVGAGELPGKHWE